MKTLLILTALLLNNCITSSEPQEQEHTKHTKHTQAYNWPVNSISIDSTSLWSYSVYISIYDFKGGGYSDKNTSEFDSLQNCMLFTGNKVLFDTTCINEYFTDYADILAITIIKEVQ